MLLGGVKFEFKKILLKQHSKKLTTDKEIKGYFSKPKSLLKVNDIFSITSSSEKPP